MRLCSKRFRMLLPKLALLLAFSRGAELLVLDEPTSGLDPAVAEEVLQALVSHVAGEEMTVFFSSHQIAEVDQIADRIVIIDRGVCIPAGLVVGEDPEVDAARFRRTDGGICLITQPMIDKLGK